MRGLWITLLSLHIVLIACDRSNPAPTTTEQPEPTAPTAEDLLPLIESISRPPPLGIESIAEIRRQVLDGLDLSTFPSVPAIGAEGPLVQDVPEGTIIPPGFLPRLTFPGRVDGSAADTPMHTFERLFHREPSLRLNADGRGVVRFSTLLPIAGAMLYYGTIVPQDPLGLPRHRKQSGALRQIDGPAQQGQELAIRRYEIELNIPGLLGEKYDVGGTRGTGLGTLAWRLEVLDPMRGSSRVFDSEAPFSCTPLPCDGEGTRFTQLPGFSIPPVVDQVSNVGATVSWTTDVPTAAQLYVHTEGAEPHHFEGIEVGTRHEITIEGLEPETRYRYQPVVIDGRGKVTVHRGGTFATHAATPSRLEFVALSDSRSGAGAADDQYGGTNARVLRGLLLQAFQRQPELVVFVGDLVDGYTTSETSFRYELAMWQRTVAPFHAHIPIYEVMGNHESLVDLWAPGWAVGRRGEQSAEAIFAEHFVNPTESSPEVPEGDPPYRENTYSFDIGTTHFASVNSNYWYRSHPDHEEHPHAGNSQREGWVNDTTLAWLDDDLKAAKERGAKHLFVFTHEPAFPNGGHVRDAMWWHGRIPAVVQQRNKFCRILGEHGVTAVFHGDEHNYSRTLIDDELVNGMEHPTWQFISGGAGAPYYAREANVPWASHVRAFDPRQHFIRVVIEGDAAFAEAVSLTGERFDRVELN